MSKFTNPLHHVVAVTVSGIEHVHGPGEVWEASGDEAAAWKATPGVTSATSDDEERAEALAAARATGANPHDTPNPSGTMTSITVPSVQDHARGLVRDDHEVAQQPTLPVVGGGELTAVPDEKAALDRSDLTHEDFQALQGAAVEDAFDNFTDDELRGYAEEHGIELGQSKARSGLLTKIRAAEAAKSEEAEKVGSEQGGSSVPGVE